MNCPCKDCKKRWVSSTSRCHASCIEYKKWAEEAKKTREEEYKRKEQVYSVGNVLFGPWKKY